MFVTSMDKKSGDLAYLPITPQETISAAVECYHAGAAIIHIHVRDAQGNATQDAQLFREVVEGMRAAM